MKRMLISLVILAIVGLFSSCVFRVNNSFTNGKNVRCKGEVVTTDMQLSGFDAIRIDGKGDIEFVQAEETSVAVTANSEVFDHLDFVVEDSVLVIRTINNVNIVAEEFDIRVSAPVLKDISVNGASDFDIPLSYISEEPLSINVNGAGDFEVKNVQVPAFSVSVNGAGDLDAENLNVGSLSVTVNGAADVELSGTAASASFSISGAGDIDARNLSCEDVTTTKNGIGKIKL